MTAHISLAEAAFDNVDLKAWLVGAFISTLAFGMVISVFLTYIHSFIRIGPQPSKTKDQSRAGYVFLSYTILMFLFSTIAFIGETWGTMDMIFPAPEGISRMHITLARYGEASCLVLTSWFADGLMAWRCLILYQATTKLNRRLLTCLLCVLGLTTVGTGVTYIVTGFKVINRYMIAHALASATLNTTISVLIVLRLSYHQRHVENTLGPGYSASYTRLIQLFIESAGLIVVFNVAHVSLIRWPNYMVIIPHQLLVHMNVISALTILYRISYSLQGIKVLPTTVEMDVDLSYSQSTMPVFAGSRDSKYEGDGFVVTDPSRR